MKQDGIRKITNLLAKNSPTVLTGLSIAGVFATTALAVKATPKALILLEEERYNREKEEIVHNKNCSGPDVIIHEGKPITVKDTILLTWKCYLPATIMGVVTIACIVSANKINLRRNAALAGLYSLSETALKEYQTKVVETIGKNKEKKIKDDIAQDRVKKNPVDDKEVVMTGKGEVLCYDNLSGRYFKSSRDQIEKALNKLTRNMMTDMSMTVTLNEIYDELGLQGTKIGDMVGWHLDDGVLEADFTSCLSNDSTPCLVLDFTEKPRHLYED